MMPPRNAQPPAGNSAQACFGGVEAEDFHELKGRVGTIEHVVQRIDASTASIAESLQTLARLEERHAEVRTSLGVAWKKIDDTADDVVQLKTQLAADIPPLKETRKWVVGGIMAGVGMIMLALVGLVIQAPIPGVK